MDNQIKASLLFILLNFIILSCSNKDEDKARVTIKSSTQSNSEVKLISYNLLEQITIHESKTDSLGNSSFELALNKPIFLLIQIGNKYGEIYLSPGYDLHIEEIGQDYKLPLRFSGAGAEINNYISWVNSSVESIKWANNKGLSQLGYNEFLHRFDSLKFTINSFHNGYMDSVKLSKATISMLTFKNKIKLLQVGQEFKFYKLNNSLNENWEAQKIEKDSMEVKASIEFENITKEIPFDTILLTNGYIDYQMLLNFYWQIQINLAVAKELLVSKAPRDLAPLMSNSLLKKGNYPETIREFLLAFDIQYWLASYGITPETDSVLVDFKKHYPKSNYIPALTKIHNEWLALSPGKPAPEFDGYTSDGRKVSIKDLKGKIVYIDVWATWCAPCIAEIPASKRIQQEFSNEVNIEFLNISVDRDKTNWEKFIKEENNWKGLHLIIESDKIQSFYTTYKLFGVPDYILIDHLGNIVNMKAPRPSDEKIKTEIRQLLDKVI